MNSIRDISGFCVYVVGVCFPLFRTPDIVEKFLLIIQPLICKKKKKENAWRERIRGGIVGGTRMEKKKGEIKGEERKKEKELKCFNCIYRVFIG